MGSYEMVNSITEMFWITITRAKGKGNGRFYHIEVIARFTISLDPIC